MKVKNWYRSIGEKQHEKIIKYNKESKEDINEVFGKIKKIIQWNNRKCE